MLNCITVHISKWTATEPAVCTHFAWQITNSLAAYKILRSKTPTNHNYYTSGWKCMSPKCSWELRKMWNINSDIWHQKSWAISICIHFKEKEKRAHQLNRLIKKQTHHRITRFQFCRRRNIDVISLFSLAPSFQVYEKSFIHRIVFQSCIYDNHA